MEHNVECDGDSADVYMAFVSEVIAISNIECSGDLDIWFLANAMAKMVSYDGSVCVVGGLSY